MRTLVERLRESAKEFELPPSIQSMRNIRAIDAMNEAAEALSARLTPPAEVVRYNLVRGEYFDDMEAYPTGEWVRYEDHAAALAASEAKRKDAEELLERVAVHFRAGRTIHAGSDLANKIAALDQPKTEDAA